MVKMISKRAHRYGTRMMEAGDRFDAHGENDARVMVALGWADRAAKVEEVVAKPAPKARKPRAAEPVAPVAETPFERTVPLAASELIAEPSEPTAAPKRTRLTLRRLADFGAKDE